MEKIRRGHFDMKYLNTSKLIEESMSFKRKNKDGQSYFDEKDVRDMMCKAESWGYSRAELFLCDGVCNICTGSGIVDRYDSFTGKIVEPPYEKMCCWKCCGDGKLPAKCSRHELEKHLS
jgi:hypothetical protein